MLRPAVVLSALVLLASSIPVREASASLIHYQTPAGSQVSGNPVDVRVTFLTLAGSVGITIENLLDDPIDVKQVVYGLKFTLSTGQNSGTLTSITGAERTVSNNGAFADGAAGSFDDWTVATAGSQVFLDRLSAPGQKQHGVIGGPQSLTNAYDAANGSIAGNGPHNAFLQSGAFFLLAIPGVTANSTVTAATVAFNTSTGYEISTQVVPVPEPGAAALTVLAMISGAAYWLCRSSVRGLVRRGARPV